MRENLVLFCNCQARNEKAEWTEKARILEMNPEIQHVMLNDLCGLCAGDPKKLTDRIDSARRVLLIACHPRAVKLLLQYAGVINTEQISYFNMPEEDNQRFISVIEEITGHPLTFPGDQPITAKAKDGSEVMADLQTGTTLVQFDPSWTAWYPVIDHSRCIQCGQCVDFCLFGVYGKTEGGVEVINPANCKDNCPACARICPGVAIVFPKYTGGGAIGGSAAIDDHHEMKRLLQDTETILGDDIYQALEQRKLKRRSIIREDTMKKAIREREEALMHTRPAGENPPPP
jgi:Pyruvate/2-oxoacid:ferredoxin oxidoreductase delta subunit